MKTLFTYLTMIVLFIIGTRLVTAQQKYTRSRQELAPVAPKTLPFQQYLQLASQTYDDVKLTTDADMADVASNDHTIDKSPNRETAIALKNRKSIKR